MIQPTTCTAVSPRSSARSTPRVSSTRHQASSRRSRSTFSVQSDSRATPTSAAIHHCRLVHRERAQDGVGGVVTPARQGVAQPLSSGPCDDEPGEDGVQRGEGDQVGEQPGPSWAPAGVPDDVGVGDRQRGGARRGAGLDLGPGARPPEGVPAGDDLDHLGVARRLPDRPGDRRATRRCRPPGPSTRGPPPGPGARGRPRPARTPPRGAGRAAARRVSSRAGRRAPARGPGRPARAGSLRRGCRRSPAHRPRR